MSTEQEATQYADELEAKSAQDVIAWAVGKFGNRITVASSFGLEDVVLIDLFYKADPNTRIFTLDTGRLNNETYQVMDACRAKYPGLNLEVYFPQTQSVQELEEKKGFFSFRESVENRKECCGIRKVEPLGRALGDADAWVTGLRRAQSVTRTDLAKVEIDHGHNDMFKVNPLLDWSEQDLWDYIKENNVPYNALHDQNVPSIGCEPCTRAIKPGEDVRAGRWWWESPDTKECGLHPVEEKAAS